MNLTVGYVDASGDAAAGEREDVQRGEVRLEERVLLKLPRPRHVGEELLGVVDERGVAFRHVPVDHGDEALELPAHPRRVAVRLDEPDVPGD